MNDLILARPTSVSRSSSKSNYWDAEDAILVEDVEVAAPKKFNHFIEANTQEVTLQHLKHDCIIPNFSDMQETISHVAFIQAVTEAAHDYFCGEHLDEPEMRVSHPIHGRIPTALGKPAKDLLPSERTLFYERACFCFEVPSITHEVFGQRLNLSICGTRALNEINLHGKKKAEKFRLAIGFTNQVCSNLMLTTDGLASNIEVYSASELYQQALILFHSYQPSKDLNLIRMLGAMHISESEFCHILGRMRLYQCLPPHEQRNLPTLKLGDSQINAACKAFVSDPNFKNNGDGITGWQMVNLLNGAAKSSYIDNFLERNLNCTEFVQGIMRAKEGDEEYQWFLS